MADVFGIARDVPANYVTRPDVDGKFIESLTRDKHVVVFGSSKQGKTCLRKYNLVEGDYIPTSKSRRSQSSTGSSSPRTTTASAASHACALSTPSQVSRRSPQSALRALCGR